MRPMSRSHRLEEFRYVAVDGRVRTKHVCICILFNILSRYMLLLAAQGMNRLRIARMTPLRNGKQVTLSR